MTNRTNILRRINEAIDARDSAEADRTETPAHADAINEAMIELQDFIESESGLSGDTLADAIMRALESA